MNLKCAICGGNLTVDVPMKSSDGARRYTCVVCFGVNTLMQGGTIVPAPYRQPNERWAAVTDARTPAIEHGVATTTTTLCGKPITAWMDVLRKHFWPEDQSSCGDCTQVAKLIDDLWPTAARN